MKNLKENNYLKYLLCSKAILFGIILMQISCNTYKKASVTELAFNKSYKFESENKKYKAKFVKENDSILIFKNKNKEISIEKSKINSLERRKFSVGKTLGLGVASAIGIVVLDYIIDPKIGTGTKIDNTN